MTKFARKVPRTNYLKPLTETKLESLRKTNKLNAMNLLKDANKNAPNCFQRYKFLEKSIEKQKSKTTFVRKSIPNFKVKKITIYNNYNITTINNNTYKNHIEI